MKNKEEVRKIYLENRDIMVEDFKGVLKSIQLNDSNVNGVIAGMDYQQFSILRVFHYILEQEEYVLNKQKSPWIIFEEEQIILAEFVKQAKNVFGKEYDDLYKHYKSKEY